MSPSVLSRATPAAKGHVVDRSLAVFGAAAATGLIWVIATAGLGLDVSQPGFGSMPPQPLSLWWVTSVTVIAGLAGWGVLALIERVSGRPAVVWLIASVVALAFSLGGPLSGDGVGVADRLALTAMHVSAGAVLIPVFYLSARQRKETDR